MTDVFDRIHALRNLSQPKVGEKDEDSDKLEKGKPVRVGSKEGRIVYLHPQMKIARVRMDDGKMVTVSQSALKVLPHVTVQSHIRKVPSK